MHHFMVRVVLLIALFGALLPSGAQFATPVAAQGGNALFSLDWNALFTRNTNDLAWGDVDGDGDLDLALANQNQPLDVYLNDGAGNLSRPGAARWPAWNPQSAPSYAVAWGDLDGDRDLDLVLGNDGTSSIYRNTGSGLSSSDIVTFATPGLRDLGLADFTGDGYLDVVAVSSTETRVFASTGNQAGILAANPSTRAGGAESLAIADLDGDGDQDLVVGATALANDCAQDQTGLCTNEISFTPFGNVVVGDVVQAVAVGDVNGDDKLDLAIGSSSAGASRVYLNRCTGEPCLPVFANNETDTLVLEGTAGFNTTGITLGDMDNDGDLDLALSNNNLSDSPLQIFENCGSEGQTCAFGFRSISGTPANLKSAEVTWVDIDSDGMLDLALANYLQPSQIYRNTQSPTWSNSPLPIGNFQAVDWGDADGDGNLDLVLAGTGALTVVRNPCAGGEEPCVVDSADTTVAVAPGANIDAESVAWGDFDLDGDLDLVIANNVIEGESDDKNVFQAKLFANTCNPNAEGVCSGTFAFSDTSTVLTRNNLVYTLAWGDLEGDGDLDLAIGGASGAAVYVNTCTLNAGACQAGSAGFTTTPLWTATGNVRSLAWADMNADGAPDLALGISGAPGQLYLNQSARSGLPPLAASDLWQAETHNTRSIAAGDIDGDGAMDLVVGPENEPAQLYRNQSGNLVLDRTWTPAPAATRSIALGDLDGDGDLDLILANDNQPTQIYRNVCDPTNAGTCSNGDGGFANTPLWTSQTTPSARSLTLGDADRDGDLDVAFAARSNGSNLYLNRLADGKAPLNEPPVISVQGVQTTGAALNPASVISEPAVTISLNLRDAESDPVGAIYAEYSLDGGGRWTAAEPSAGQDLTDLTTNPNGSQSSFRWNIAGDRFFGRSDNVLFRVRTYNRPVAGQTNAPLIQRHHAAGSQQRPFSIGVSEPLRIRGRQVQVVDTTTPLADAIVYRLQDGLLRGGLPLADLAGTPFRTDTQGYLNGRAEIGVGDRLAALVPVNIALAPAADLPDISDSIRLFYTSPISLTTGRPETEVQGASNIQLLNIAPWKTRPLILFDVTVGVEWDARNDRTYLNELERDLLRASELLYDWTDGQAAMGNLTVTFGLDAFDAADIKIFANNRLRPNADAGGIVEADFEDTVTISTTTETIIYEPGHIRMGSVWSRYGGGSGNADDWARAMAHEFGHFALFLEDNYIGRNAENQIVSVPDPANPQAQPCRGAMSDPYRNDFSEFHPGGERWDADCATTNSEVDTGRADWETIKRFFDRPDLNFILDSPEQFGEVAGPGSQSLNFTSVSFVGVEPDAVVPPELLGSRDLNLLNTDNTAYRYTPGTQVRAFRFSQNGTRLTDLGRPNGERLLVRGAAINDEVCVYDQTAGLSGCVTVITDTRELQLQPLGWSRQPEVRLTPLPNQQLQVDLIISDPPPTPADSVTAQLFDGESLQLAVQQQLTAQTSDGSRYSGVIDYSSVITNGRTLTSGYTRIVAGYNGSEQRQLMTDYTLIGAILAPNKATLESSHCLPGQVCAPVLGSNDGQFLIDISDESTLTREYYSLQTATQLPARPAWSIPVGQSYRVITSLQAEDAGLAGAYVTAAYLEDELPPGSEDGLALYYWNENNPGAGWQTLTISRFDRDRNEISAPLLGTGLYMLATRLELRQGWNVFSFPWTQPTTIADALAYLNIDSANLNTIYSYEGDSAADPWKLYDVAAPDWVNDLTELRYGRGYWVNLPQDVGVPPMPQAEAALAAGLPVPPATYYAMLDPDDYPDVQPDMPITAWIGNTQCGAATIVERTLDARQYYTFVIHIASVFEQAGCGIPGQSVTFRLGGEVMVEGKFLAGVTWSNDRPRQLLITKVYLPAVSR